MAEPITTNSERDWPEDFRHENGNYSCDCESCGKSFVGHKRRIQCKVCHIKQQDATIAELRSAVEQLKREYLESH